MALQEGELKHLGSFNGIGFGMKGLTRVDASGRCFATRWFMFIWMPVIPLTRYYLTEGKVTFTYSSTTTQYVVHGQSRLRVDEVLRTYAFCWLIGPGIVGALMLPFLNYANQDAPSLWVLVGAFLGGLLAAGAILGMLHTAYRKRWAPLRTVNWLAARPN